MYIYKPKLLTIVVTKIIQKSFERKCLQKCITPFFWKCFRKAITIPTQTNIFSKSCRFLKSYLQDTIWRLHRSLRNWLHSSAPTLTYLYTYDWKSHVQGFILFLWIQIQNLWQKRDFLFRHKHSVHLSSTNKRHGWLQRKQTTRTDMGDAERTNRKRLGEHVRSQWEKIPLTDNYFLVILVIIIKIYISQPFHCLLVWNYFSVIARHTILQITTSFLCYSATVTTVLLIVVLRCRTSDFERACLLSLA